MKSSRFLSIIPIKPKEKGIGLWFWLLLMDGEMKTDCDRVNFVRRKRPRFSVELPVEYRKIRNSENHPAQTGDLREGGLLLYISESLEIGEEGYFHTGARFLEIGPDDLKMLKGFFA